MIEFDTIINIIQQLAPHNGGLIIQQARKNESVIKICQVLKLNPTEIPDDIDTVYAYTLVEYGVFKNPEILKLFRNKKIKDYFWDAYSNNTPFQFLEDVWKFLEQESNLQTDIHNANINLLAELEEFGEVFISIAKRTKSKKYKPYPDWNLDVYPQEFKALIFEKTRLFCGRQFVFAAIRDFLNSKSKGYFTVIGDAGMGKSSIAAQFILLYQYPCYFNILAEGRNTPEKFLNSIRQQLIKRYSLNYADEADLRTVLQKASEELNGQQLVIVVDALDEVEQKGDGNLLDLPQNIPDGVYFLLTRRPYYQKTKRLTLSPDTPVQELDLTEEEYQNFSAEDIKQYLVAFLNNDKDHKDKLQQWILDQNISQEKFIQEVAAKSENNFMYLRYVLPWIAEGKQSGLTLQGLPQGLKDYYQVHWRRMDMEEDANEIKVKILYVLVARGEPISRNMIAEILEQDEYEVELILDDWIEYVTPKINQDEQKIYYSIYHRSFLEFLQGQDKLEHGRKLFREVNQKINDYFGI